MALLKNGLQIDTSASRQNPDLNRERLNVPALISSTDPSLPALIDEQTAHPAVIHENVEEQENLNDATLERGQDEEIISELPVREQICPIRRQISAGSVHMPLKVTVGIVNIKDTISKESQDYAEAKVTRKTETKSGFLGRTSMFLKNVWDGATQDFRRIGHEATARRQIVETGNLYAGDEAGMDTTASDQAKKAIIERFTSQFHMETVEHEAGETREIVGGPEAQEIRGLLMDYAMSQGVFSEARAAGADTEQLFTDERDRIVRAISGNQHSKSVVNEYADNMLEVGRTLRAKFLHEGGLENVQIDVVQGLQKHAIRSETRSNKAEALIEKMRGNKLGSLVVDQPLVAALTFAAGKLLLNNIKGVSARAAGLGSGGAAIAMTAGFAYVNTGRRLERQRRVVARDNAKSKEATAGMPLRNRIDQHSYQLESAEDLTADIRDLLAAFNAAANPRERQAASNDLLESIAKVDALNRIAAANKIDLIRYEGSGQVESQYKDLKIVSAEAKAALRERLLAGEVEGEDEESIFAADCGKYDAFLQVNADCILSEIGIKNKTFKTFKGQRQRKAAFVAATLGLVLGEAAQELAALGDDKSEGLLEHLTHAGTGNAPDAHATPLEALDERLISAEEALKEYLGGKPLPHDVVKTLTMDGDKGSSAIYVPEGTTIANDQAHPGDFSFMRDGHVMASGLSTDEYGRLTPESLQILHHQGANIDSHVETHHHVLEHGGTMTGTDYVLAHKGHLDAIHRGGPGGSHLDNNTPEYDGMELSGRVGATENGQIALSFHGHEDAFHGKYSVNPADLARLGKVKVLITPSRQFQHEGFVLPTDEHGSTVIDPHSEAGKFFKPELDHSGKITGYKYVGGGFVEWGIEHGKNSHRFSEFATEEGLNHPIPSGPVEETYPVDTFGVSFPKGADQPNWDLPWFAPLPLGDALEPVKEIASSGADGSGGRMVYANRNGRISDLAPGERLPNGRLRMTPEISSLPATLENLPVGRLWHQGEMYRRYNDYALRTNRRNPVERQQLSTGETVWKNAEGSPVERNVRREQAAIEQYIMQEPLGYRKDVVFFAQQMGPMDPECRVAVAMPAFQEGQNIYRTLEEYCKQTDKEGNVLDPRLFEIDVLDNRPDNPDIPWDDTRDEVVRFVAEHPGVRIKLIQQAFPPSDARVGFARKLLTDVIVARSADREDRQVAPLYIESEDADLERVDPHTIFNIIQKLDTQPHLDAVKGVQDRNLLHENNDNDLFLLDQRFKDFTETAMQRLKYRIDKNPKSDFTWNRVFTNGWNTALSAEAYALVGGYDHKRVKGEDLDIGMKISMLRGKEEDGRIVPTMDTVARISNRSDSSPRRYLDSLIRETAAYEGFGDGKVEERIRSTDTDEMFAQLAPYARIESGNKDKFERVLSRNLSWYDLNFGREVSAELFDTGMLWLGFKKEDWRIADNKIQIVNTENFARACESYRTLGPLHLREYEFAEANAVDPERFLAGIQSRFTSGDRLKQFKQLPPDKQAAILDGIRSV